MTQVLVSTHDDLVALTTDHHMVLTLTPLECLHIRIEMILETLGVRLVQYRRNGVAETWQCPSGNVVIALPVRRDVDDVHITRRLQLWQYYGSEDQGTAEVKLLHDPVVGIWTEWVSAVHVMELFDEVLAFFESEIGTAETSDQSVIRPGNAFWISTRTS
jgi:hypothetical protein